MKATLGNGLAFLFTNAVSTLGHWISEVADFLCYTVT